MTELVVVEQHRDQFDLVEKANAAIERLKTATPTEAKAIRDDADLLHELLQKRGWALDATYPLAEIKVTAERKIGAERARVPRDYGRKGQAPLDWDNARKLTEAGMPRKEVARLTKVSPNSLRYAEGKGWERPPHGHSAQLTNFDQDLGITSKTGNLWQRIASIPDSDFDQYLKTIKKSGQEITTTRVLYQHGVDLKKAGERVEPGIRRLKDGRHVITYRARGRTYRETLDTTDLTEARRQRLKRRGVLKTEARKEAASLDRAYSDLRSCLDKLSKTNVSDKAKRHNNAAIAALHKAEDHLLKALAANGT